MHQRMYVFYGCAYMHTRYINGEFAFDAGAGVLVTSRIDRADGAAAPPNVIQALHHINSILRHEQA